jgi:GT2 family glycosyltransferase
MTVKNKILDNNINKIASITVFCNEVFRLNPWIVYYKDYANEIFLHIIVNNGDKNDSPLLKKSFPNSIILECESKALTSAYNIGLSYALACVDINAIMLVGNDIKLPKGNVTKLYQFLKSNDSYGMVAPIILKKDSELIETYGAMINQKNLAFNHLNRESSLHNLANSIQLTDSVPGGMNLASRKFYEKVGLQDENLFMYSDEIDTGIKAKKFNFLLASTSNICAWHQHVNKSDSKSRIPLSGYLIGRNEIYLARKYFGNKVVFHTFLLRLSRAIRLIAAVNLKSRTKDEKIYALYYLRGVLAGLLNNMNLDKILNS